MACKKDQRKRNPIAKALRTGQNRPQVIADKRQKLKEKAEKNDRD